MLSNDLKPWTIHNLLEQETPVNTILMGTYLVNPYKLPGPVYKLSADQRNSSLSDLTHTCKVCAQELSKGTLPGILDVYRIIGKDGKADRDVILLRGVDSIDHFMFSADQGKIQLNQQVMQHGELSYDIPDMCKLIEFAAYHRNLLRPEHRRFRNATEYPVIISPTIQKIQEQFTKKYAQGRL